MRLAWREHPTLAAGITLPLALALWLGLTRTLPLLAVPAPRYDAVYLVNDASDAINTLHIDVIDNRLAATFVGVNFGYGWPQLFRYHADTGEVEEIAIPHPPTLPLQRPYNRPAGEAREEPHVPVPISDMENLKLNPAAHAPDDYVFRAGSNSATPLDLWQGNEEGFAYITRGPKRIAIPAPEGAGRPIPRFLGWVIP